MAVRRGTMPWALALVVGVVVIAGGALPATQQAEAAVAAEAAAAIRVNQLGYLPAGRKVAVYCTTDSTVGSITFRVERESVGDVLGPQTVEPAGAFGPCRATFRLDFSSIREPGRYRIAAGEVVSPVIRIGADVYRGAADTLLRYMRNQRSRFNPLFRDSVHHRTDGILVDHPDRQGEFIPVSGGWADAADYLQYVTTSAHATYMMLMAYRDYPQAFDDAFDASGLPGANGIADVLDEALWGLDWLLRMYPEPDLVLHQLGDDRDHAFPDLPVDDSSDYGWGKRGSRPVYPCMGRPQGLFDYRNRSDGVANIAGKFAAAFALGSRILSERDAARAHTLARKAAEAYSFGRADPGVCQTAPARQPYFYEEENWVDDMELAAAQLYEVVQNPDLLRQAADYALREPVSPWMGRDTAKHYQWYPWHNNGHYQLWRVGEGAQKRVAEQYYWRGLDAVAVRARENGFRVGIPFIWCSNNLMVSFATQAFLYRQMTGDTAFVEYETAALDWIFGTNPWGVSMVIGLPADGVTPRDPHSIIAKRLGVRTQTGGLVDGPVYRSIFENLRYVQLTAPDEYAVWNTGRIVYHDDFGDYSTNEPIMDGTANLIYLLAALGS